MDLVKQSEQKGVYTPDLQAFRRLARDAVNLIPVYRVFPADLETPVTVYLKMMDTPGSSFLLESVEGGERVGRFSFVGMNPSGSVALKEGIVMSTRDKQTSARQIGADEDILDLLREELDHKCVAKVDGLPRFVGGAVGYLGYDVVRSFEKLPATAKPVLEMPDAVFLLADTLIVFDHARHVLMIMSNAALGENEDGRDVEAAYVEAIQDIERVSEKLQRPLPAIPRRQWHTAVKTSRSRELISNQTETSFSAMVKKAKEYIAAGDIFQVVLSQRLSRRIDAHPFGIYRALRMLNPSPYMFYFDFNEDENIGKFQVIGSSPELHVRLEDGIASVRPIAGTRRRGEDDAEDMELEKELLGDEKERAEHVMLVDLGRNDLGKVSQYGTVAVREMMQVERYSHVMHIVSHVEGQLRPELDAFDLMKATFPAGTVSGAPKIRAMEIIEELEGERRGLYAGAVGYFSHDGTMDTCIAIRTMVVKDDQVYIQAGAGIVADSDPVAEYQECLNKAHALAVAVDNAQSGML